MKVHGTRTVGPTLVCRESDKPGGTSNDDPPQPAAGLATGVSSGLVEPVFVRLSFFRVENDEAALRFFVDFARPTFGGEIFAAAVAGCGPTAGDEAASGAAEEPEPDPGLGVAAPLDSADSEDDPVPLPVPAAAEGINGWVGVAVADVIGQTGDGAADAKPAALRTGVETMGVAAGTDTQSDPAHFQCPSLR